VSQQDPEIVDIPTVFEKLYGEAVPKCVRVAGICNAHLFLSALEHVVHP
jgi:hypothetical protein